MKRRNEIGLLLFAALLAACRPAPVERQGMASPRPELSAIDSLMWRQPDSALVLLQGFAASPGADSLDAFNGHYFQLLLSELLYKNYYAQSNREELLKAVGYFDSLTMEHGQGAGKRSAEAQDRNAFLDARAHYINGVGFCERGDAALACAEYLRAVEGMEEHFEQERLIARRAQFLALAYNRLGDLFSDQFMMTPSLDCYEKALGFCVIEPTSQHGVSNTLFRIGKQYDKMNDIVNAKSCYEQAMEGMVSKDNVLYRDMVTSKAMCDYQLGTGMERVMDDLRMMVACADNEEERLNRFLTIGAIWAEEGVHDSALFYFVPVFRNALDIVSRMRAAESLRNIYFGLGDREKSEECALFLASHKKTEGETKALVSKLEDMFNDHMSQKQRKEAEAERVRSIKKTTRIIVPIAVVAVLAVIALSVQSLKKFQKTQHTKQAALSGRLKRKSQEVIELKDRVRQLEDVAAKPPTAASFTEEPVCRLILGRVREGRFKSKVDPAIYKDYALDRQQLLDLRAAADRHFSLFTSRLRKAYPKLTSNDIDYCCLCLLNLNYADVSALLQRAYGTVVERNSKIQKIFGSEKPIPVIVMAIAQNTSTSTI